MTICIKLILVLSNAPNKIAGNANVNSLIEARKDIHMEMSFHHETILCTDGKTVNIASFHHG